MSNTADFVIENGVLVKYTGTDAAVTIPDGVTEIGSRSFFECQTLTAITIPEGVTKIGAAAFHLCFALSSVTLPQGLTTIAAYAFYHCLSLRDITIPNTVTKIGNCVFRDCTALQSAILLGSVAEFGDKVFENCPRLIRVMTRQKALFDRIWKELPRQTQMRLLVQAVIDRSTDPNMLAKIKGNRDHLVATAAELDDEALVVYLFSLYKTISLEKLDEYIELAQGAPKVAAFLLAYKNQRYSPQYQAEREEIQMEKDFGLREKTLTDWKKIYTLKKEDGRYVISGYRGDEEIVEIPATLAGLPVVIGERAFSYTADRISDEVRQRRNRIRVVTIADGITEMGPWAFYDCDGITTVTLPTNLKVLSRAAFAHCDRLTDIVIPVGVTTIEQHALASCRSLTAIAIPDSVTEIGIGAFDSCSRLTSFTFPAGVTYIAPYTLSECRALTAVTIPDSVTRIGREAFSRCISLTTVTIPENVALIEGGAFADCGALTDVYVTSPNTVLGQAVFENCPSVTIHAPEGSAAQRYARTFDIPFVAI